VPGGGPAVPNCIRQGNLPPLRNGSRLELR
jgi:hypothetical protein